MAIGLDLENKIGKLLGVIEKSHKAAERRKKGRSTGRGKKGRRRRGPYIRGDKSWANHTAARGIMHATRRPEKTAREESKTVHKLRPLQGTGHT